MTVASRTFEEEQLDRIQKKMKVFDDDLHSDMLTTINFSNFD